MDRTTGLVALARFASAIARLCLGPLLPVLSISLGFSESSKPAMLSSYSSGYILTQLAGGYLADKYGFGLIISATVGLSAALLFYISTFAVTDTEWIRAFFCMGLVAGPLFPAGSAAISSQVQTENRAASAAIVDAAASAGSTVAAMAPILAEQFGWRVVYQLTATLLALTSVATSQVLYSSTTVSSSSKQSSPRQDTTSSMLALFQPVPIFTYLCHSVDNFTKYSINAWAATMLVQNHNASQALVGTILGAQESVGVVSKIIVGVLFSASSTSFTHRGVASALAFLVQAVCLWASFLAPTAWKAGCCLLVSSIAVGGHSVGFRPIYVEASPEHAGAISGLGNTIASFASVLGPVFIGSAFQENDGGSSWTLVSNWMLTINLFGCLAAMGIALSRGAKWGRMARLFQKGAAGKL